MEQKFRLVNKLLLGNGIKRLDIQAPVVARSFQPGQFVMVCPEDGGKWIPMTIVEANAQRGIISIIFKETGDATRKLGALPINDQIFSITGPFGQVKEPRQVGVVLCVATGVAIAQILPMCRAYSRAGNKVIGIIGARTKAELILEPQMRISCHKVFLTTEDGSYQRRGTAEDMVKEVFAKEDVHLVYSVGNVKMMKQIAWICRQEGIPNLIQVSAVMSCGRGICGSCRVKSGGKLVLSCEEGPEFDSKDFDFDYLLQRMDCACRTSESDVKNGMNAKLGFLKKLFEKE